MVRNGCIEGKSFHRFIQGFHSLSVTEQPISQCQECDLQRSLPILDQWFSSTAHSTLFSIPNMHALGPAGNVAAHLMTSGNNIRMSEASREIEQLPSHNFVVNTRYTRFDPSITSYLPSPGLSSGTSSDRPSPWSGSSGYGPDLEDFKAHVSPQPQVWTPIKPSPYFLAPPVDLQFSLLDNYVPGLDTRSMVPHTDSSPLSTSPGFSNETDGEVGSGSVSTSPLHVSGYTSDYSSSQSVSRPESSPVSSGADSFGDYVLGSVTHDGRASSQNPTLEVTLENQQGHIDRSGTITSTWKNTVGSSAILEASRRRRTKEASHFCTWPGCIASFTARHNLESKSCSIFLRAPSSPIFLRPYQVSPRHSRVRLPHLR
jgi:hypothetical protein